MRGDEREAIDVSMVDGPICATSLPIVSKIKRIRTPNKGAAILFS